MYEWQLHYEDRPVEITTDKGARIFLSGVLGHNDRTQDFFPESTGLGDTAINTGDIVRRCLDLLSTGHRDDAEETIGILRSYPWAFNGTMESIYNHARKILGGAQ